MTSRFDQRLLEDLVDGELASDEAGSARRLIGESPELQSEYQASLQLKELLGHQTTPEPDQGYWDDVERRILSRVDSEQPLQRMAPRSGIADRQALLRSIVSVGISLALLFSALAVGSYQKGAAVTQQVDSPIFALTPLEVLPSAQMPAFVSTGERDRLMRATVLIGAPGTISRMNFVFDAIR